VTAAIELRPRGPYDLRMTLGGVRDGTLRLHDDGAELAFATAAGPAHARVVQRRDGALTIAIDAPDAPSALDRLRFLLGVDDDISPFLALAARDPLLSASVARSRGLRAPRAGTCLHALIKALAGQLVTFSEARRIERGIVFRVGRPHAGLRLSPERADLALLSAAEVCASGLAPRRAAALVRISALLELERLRSAPPDGVAARLGRERQLGPWSIGTFFLNGLGRYDRGLVGDLGLIKLCSVMLGRRAEAHDTARLLEPYGEWAGLASLHLLRMGARQERAPLARTASA
jgi:AraC family transcriptional regulator of adaptative response / DNA-3-methyladenine glycosylase II